MIQNTKSNAGIILASKSPRRRYLLKQAGLEFSVIPSSFNENSVTMTAPEPYARILAESKARVVSEIYPDRWVIGADTIVLIDNKVLGKPGSNGEAREMLLRLSGKTHQVLTGYCVCCKAAIVFFLKPSQPTCALKIFRAQKLSGIFKPASPLIKPDHTPFRDWEHLSSSA